MGEETARGMVGSEWVTGLVSQAFGGTVPAAVEPWVDAELCARLIEGSKLGCVFRIRGAETPRVRVAHDGESERLVDLARKAFPAASAWLDRFAGHDLLFETDGSSMRLYVTGLEGDGPFGYIWQDGQEYEAVLHESAPTDLPASLAGPVGQLLSQVEGGMFITVRKGGEVLSLFWASEGNWSPGLDAVIDGLGGGASLAAARAAYADAGLKVQPYSVEFHADGRTDVCLWGAQAVQQASGLPIAFEGVAPKAETFAEHLVMTLPEDVHAEASELITGALYPTLMDLKAPDVSAEEHLVACWRFLIGLLALQAPFDRMEALRRVTAVNRMAMIERQAFALAIERYLASHPDAPTRATGTVVRAAEDVRADAEALLAEYEQVALVVASDPDVDDHRFRTGDFEVVSFDLQVAKDLLHRAISGDFAAAEGPLHDFLVELGPTGYDDDPSLVSLDNVDLEGNQDAAIEEALAYGYEQDDEEV